MVELRNSLNIIQKILYVILETYTFSLHIALPLGVFIM